MNPNRLSRLWLISFILLCAGCVGVGTPQPLDMKPWTLIRGGDQIGRDQLANRWLVASKIIPVTGMHENDVLSILGQPQSVKIIDRQKDSSDWYYIYYKKYKTQPKTDEGSFLIRFYEQKVIDIVKIN